MLLIGWASVCKDGMPTLPFVGKRESCWGLALVIIVAVLLFIFLHLFLQDSKSLQGSTKFIRLVFVHISCLILLPIQRVEFLGIVLICNLKLNLLELSYCYG